MSFLLKKNYSIDERVLVYYCLQLKEECVLFSSKIQFVRLLQVCDNCNMERLREPRRVSFKINVLYTI